MGTDQFTAKVTGVSNTAVSWSIKEGAAGGTISSTGLYKAPATAGTYHVIATSVADSTESSTMAVTVTAVTVSVTAASSAVNATATDQFTAIVTGSKNVAVTWSIKEGAAGGTISSTGLYKAPATAGTYHVVATSVADTLASASMAVTVSIPSVAFTSTPSTTLAEGATYTYTITATSATSYALTTGPAGASISGDKLTWTPSAAELLMPSNFTVKASSGLGTSASQSWTVTPKRAVTMNLLDNFWSNGGPTQSSIGAIPAPVGALVPGSSTLLAATLSSDGTYYTIHNVPAGYYWLYDGPTERHWTNTSTFDVGTDYVGRQIGSSATAMTAAFGTAGPPATTLAIDSFGSGEAIFVGSANANSWWAPTTQPVSGAVAYSDTEIIPAKTLPSLESGDASYVLQYEWNSNSGNYLGLSIMDSQVEGSGFVSTASTYAPAITGSLTHGTAHSMTVTTSGWPTLTPSAEPTASSTFFGTYLWAQPYTTAPLAAMGGGMPACLIGNANAPCAAGTNGWPLGSGPEPATIYNAPHDNRQAGSPGPLYVAWAERCQAQIPPATGDHCEGAADGDSIDLSFNDPFPSSWPYVLWSQQETSVNLGAPDLFTMYSNSAYEFSNASSIPSSYTLKPAVEPVTSPLINGNPTFYTAASQTAPLTLSWTAATTNGGARLSGYTVVVYAVPSSGAWGNVIVKFFTAAPNTSITIPTGALSAGKYVFVIEADADGRADLSASPWRSSYPKGTAQIVSEPMTITGS